MVVAEGAIQIKPNSIELRDGTEPMPTEKSEGCPSLSITVAIDTGTSARNIKIKEPKMATE